MILDDLRLTLRLEGPEQLTVVLGVHSLKHFRILANLDLRIAVLRPIELLQVVVLALLAEEARQRITKTTFAAA